MKQISIKVENKVGALAEVCELLGNNGVNMESISAQGEGNVGVIRVVTTDEKTAGRVLEKAGYKTTIGDITTFRVKDRPGELAKATRKLAKAGVDIECIYLLKKNGDEGEFAVKTSSIEQIRKALG